jgi:NAD(P)-dependent dehydrogenase (short-subunit alcohol dehydrogenase family)
VAGFEGRSGIITGGGSGLGREVVHLITKDGGNVMILDRDGDAGGRVSDEVASHSGQVCVEIADVTSEDEVSRAIARCRSEFGSFDFIHNNAGVQLEKPLHEKTGDDWDWVNSVNLKGVFFGCKHAVISMRQSGGGSIVNTASILAHTADPFLPAYTATKTGVLGLTRAVAVAYAPDGIRCNCVSPGDMETPMLQKYFDATPDPQAARREMEISYPGQRVAHPREVAQAAVFLLSEQASFVSGEFILVDGALTAKTY